MNSAINEIVKSSRICEGSLHDFFGYYDVPAFSLDGRYHLAHRTGLYDRLPRENEPSEIGVVDIMSREFIKVGETYAWNFQQGSMLQWNPKAPNDEIIFNVKVGGELLGMIMNIHTGEKRLLQSPVANVDPSGRFALSINFGRLLDFRPVCGYYGLVDGYSNENCPGNDGVFLLDMDTGRSRLIVSYERIWEVSRHTAPSRDEKIVINHITFNPDGTRFLFLVRTFPKNGKDWTTAVITANTDGSELYCVRGYSYASHYNWRDSDHFMLFCSPDDRADPKEKDLYLLTDRTRKADFIDREYFKGGHMSYSPDRKWILNDGGADKDSYKGLFLYNVEMKKGVTLGCYYADRRISGDIRCDLHPRWNRTGSAISFDSIHEGERHIYYMDLKEVINGFK